MIGLATGCLDHTMKYVMDRKQFGQSIWDFQVRKILAHLYLYSNFFV